MNTKQKFENFLKSLKGKGQTTLIESIEAGFRVCFESALEGHGTAEDEIIKGYVDAMFWTEEETLNDKDLSDLAPETINKIISEVKMFYNKTHELINQTPDEYTDEYGYTQVGHDFWLTRNGHGAGFWDRGLGELGDKLTSISKQFGESNLYEGDDGKLYLG